MFSPPNTTQAAQAIDLGGVEFGFKNKNKFNIPDEDNPDGLRSPRPLAYRIEFTDPPTTVPFPREFEVGARVRACGRPWLDFGSGENVLEGQRWCIGIGLRCAERLLKSRSFPSCLPLCCLRACVHAVSVDQTEMH